MPVSESHPYCIEIELPTYTRPNLPKRAAIIEAMLDAATELAPDHIAEHYGIKDDAAHLIRVSTKLAAMRLRLRNQELLRAAYRS